MLNQERLKELLEYDPLTGIFIRKITVSTNALVGMVAGDFDNGYWRIMVDKKRYKSHRLAWLYVYGHWPKNHIDHIDHDTLNNCIANLRDVSRSGNLQNQIIARKDNSTGYLGVSFDKRSKKYLSHIGVNGKAKHLGTFVTAKEAYSAYLSAKRIYHQTCTI